MKHTMIPQYCANDPCEAPAWYFIPETETPLCNTCAEAYRWGQEQLEVPDNRELIPLSEWEAYHIDEARQT